MFGEKNRGIWAWVGSLGFREDDDRWVHKCGSTLISRNFLLSSAYCAQQMDPTWKVRLGDRNLTNPRDDKYVEEKSLVLPAAIHDQYERVDDNGEKEVQSVYFDVAVVKLSSPVTQNPGVKPICLPEVPNWSFIDKYAGHTVYLQGWGETQRNGGDVKDILLYQTVTIVDQKQCNESYNLVRSQGQIRYKRDKLLPRLLQESIICASGLEGAAACPDDAGGPIAKLRPNDDRFVQLGIASASLGNCASIRYPALYARLDYPSILYFIAKKALLLEQEKGI